MIYVVIENQYDKNVSTPFKEVVGVFSSPTHLMSWAHKQGENTDGK